MRFLIGMAVMSLLIQSVGQTVILVNFKINQAYIAANLCENKNIADSTCEGNCQLKKQIEQTHDAAKQLPPSFNFKELVLFAKTVKKRISVVTLTYTIKAFFPHCFPQLSRGFLLTVFHPPDED